MKSGRFLGSLLMLSLLAAPALPSRTLGDDDDDDDAVSSVSFAGVEKFEVAGGGAVDGTSILNRSEEAVAYSFSTRELQRAAPYTNWWVAFNNPEACVVPCACSDADFGNAAVDIGVFWATGRVSNGFGQAEFSAQIAYGDLPDGVDQVPFDAFASPIAPGAEIHVVVRAHGARGTADLEDQLTQFNGGCPPNPVDDLEGCVDVQFSVHRSRQCKALDDDDDD